MSCVSCVAVWPSVCPARPGIPPARLCFFSSWWPYPIILIHMTASCLTGSVIWPYGDGHLATCSLEQEHTKSLAPGPSSIIVVILRLWRLWLGAGGHSRALKVHVVFLVKPDCRRCWLELLSRFREENASKGRRRAPVEVTTSGPRVYKLR